MALQLTPSKVITACFSRMGGPREWGVNDCCSSATLVFADLFGVDIMAHLRGAFYNRKTALAILRQGGGLETIFKTQALEHGLRVADCFLPGSIGLVQGPSDIAGTKVLGILFAPNRWAVKTSQGIALIEQGSDAWAL